MIRRTFRTLNLLRAQQDLINTQRQLIETQKTENQRLRLAFTREMLGLASAWRIHMETPELDLRDDVTGLAAELANQAANLEEHVL